MYEDYLDNFWGPHKIVLYFWVISMHFRVFLKVNVQNGGIFGVANNSNDFWVLEIPDIFWG